MFDLESAGLEIAVLDRGSNIWSLLDAIFVLLEESGELHISLGGFVGWLYLQEMRDGCIYTKDLEYR